MTCNRVGVFVLKRPTREIAIVEKLSPSGNRSPPEKYQPRSLEGLAFLCAREGPVTFDHHSELSIRELRIHLHRDHCVQRVSGGLYRASIQCDGRECGIPESIGDDRGQAHGR